MDVGNFRLWAIFVILSIALSGCNPKNLIQLTPTPTPAATDILKPTSTHTATVYPSLAPSSTPTSIATITITPSPAATLIRPSAQELALNPDDLGSGWLLGAEVNDLNASYYFDRSEDGEAIIGTHRTTKKPPFDPILVDSISMRGFSNPEKKQVLFQVIVVFKEEALAEEASKKYLQTECEPPCEYSHQYDDGSGERYVYQNALIGDESILMSIWLLPDTDEQLPFGAGLFLRRGQIFMYMLSVGQWDDLDNSPPVSEDMLEELANFVYARIP